MKSHEFVKRGMFLVLGSILLLALTQCVAKKMAATDLPRNILGISVGMKKEDAVKHLQEIAKFERKERKQQELWALPEDKRFSRLALGYDSSETVRYLTAFARQQQGAATGIRYEEFGDLKIARQNVFTGNKEYVWEFPAQNDKPGYLLIVRGTDPTFALTCSLTKLTSNSKEMEEDKDED